MERISSHYNHLQPAEAEAEVLLSYKDHLRIHDSLQGLAQEVRSMTPDGYDVSLTGIPLSGEVPLHWQDRLPQTFRHLSFEAHKDANNRTATSTIIRLHDATDRQKQLSFMSTGQSVEYGRNKLFEGRWYNNSSAGKINCDNLCIMLDDLIPDLRRRFSNLVDPRTDKTFETISSAMGSILAEKAKTKELSRFYTGHVGDPSLIHNFQFDIESNVLFGIRQNGRQPLCLLEMSSPVFIDDPYTEAQHIVHQTFLYGFRTQPYKKHGKYQETFMPYSKVRLSSTDLSTAQLSGYIADSQANANGLGWVDRAIDILLSEKRVA